MNVSCRVRKIREECDAEGYARKRMSIISIIDADAGNENVGRRGAYSFRRNAAVYLH